MINNLLLVLLSFLFIVLVSCNTDREPEQPFCSTENVRLRVPINDTLVLNFQSVGFYETENSLWELSAYEFSPSCVLWGSLTIFSQKKVGIQDLIPITFSGPQIAGQINFTELNDDTILGRFELYEAEPNSVEITKVERDTIAGVINATMVWNQSGNKFITLPDTLRFTNANFKAIRYERND